MNFFRRSSNSPVQSKKSRPKRSISYSPQQPRNNENERKKGSIKISLTSGRNDNSEGIDESKINAREIPNYVVDLSVFFYDKDNPPFLLPVKGYRTEYGTDFYDMDNLHLEEVDIHSPYYKNHFENRPHLNFIGGDELNPFIISVLTEPDEELNYKCIVRTKQQTIIKKFTDLPMKKDKIVKYLKEVFVDVIKDYKMVEVKDPEIIPDLIKMEDRMVIKHYSFGVLYCKAGQKDEDEYFSNREEDTSEAYKKFLTLLGDKVPLQGFTGPKCGLDTKTNTTGTHTIYTKFKGFEIVYHVATLLPYCDKNPQQLERKRHIGNDVVCIIFLDGKGSFDPSIIHTKFTHIFAVVQYYKNKKGEDVYKIAISNKEGVVEYGPAIPNISWEFGEELREFLLTKLINGERAAYYSPNFGLSRTRRLWINEIISKYINN